MGKWSLNFFICIKLKKKNSLGTFSQSDLLADITKQRNSYFSNFFFMNTETHKVTNSADIGCVEKLVASAKRVSRRGFLDVQ